MRQKNIDVRQAVRDAGLYLWQVAYGLGITEVTLSRWLRKELPWEKKARIFEVIRELEKENKEVG